MFAAPHKLYWHVFTSIIIVYHWSEIGGNSEFVWIDKMIKNTWISVKKISAFPRDVGCKLNWQMFAETIFREISQIVHEIISNFQRFQRNNFRQLFSGESSSEIKSLLGMEFVYLREPEKSILSTLFL